LPPRKSGPGPQQETVLPPPGPFAVQAYTFKPVGAREAEIHVDQVVAARKRSSATAARPAGKWARFPQADRSNAAESCCNSRSQKRVRPLARKQPWAITAGAPPRITRFRRGTARGSRQRGRRPSGKGSHKAAKKRQDEAGEFFAKRVKKRLDHIILICRPSPKLAARHPARAVPVRGDPDAATRLGGGGRRRSVQASQDPARNRWPPNFGVTTIWKTKPTGPAVPNDCRGRRPMIRAGRPGRASGPAGALTGPRPDN